MAQEVLVAAIGLVGVLVGGGITSATTWLVARGERTKFAHEKLWEERRVAYTKIIGAMVKATRIASNISKRYEADAHGFDASPDMHAMLKQFGEAYVEAHDVFESNTLVLSTAFYRKFGSFTSQFGRDVENQNLLPPEQAERCFRVMEQNTNALRAMAEVEIDPSRSRQISHGA